MVSIQDLSPSEFRQAETIIFKIQSGISVRTDPRSRIGGVVNRFLQNVLTQSELEQEKSRRTQLERTITPKLSEGQQFLEQAGIPTGSIKEITAGREDPSKPLPLTPKATTIESQISREEVGGDPFQRTETPFEERLPSRPPSIVEAARKPEGLLEGALFELQEKRFTGSEPTKVLAGFGTSVISTLKFGKDILTEPIKTTKGVFSGFRDLGSVGEKIGRTLKQETGFAFGFIAGEALTFFGTAAAPKLFVKGSDVVRTTRLTELKAVDIIAPEFFKGQTFPTIKKGQTAGQLLEEFKPILPGETKAAGFTASPGSFKKVTETKIGTSEFPGLFQSPLVSPQFLRISGEAERKLFGLNIFETFRPTIVRVTPKAFELIPGITRGQKGLSPSFTGIREFFFSRAEKGKSFIPFAKTEKEAIIPFGTTLELTDKRFFVKFEGRRVPILEFKAEPGKALLPKKKGGVPAAREPAFLQTSDLSKILSRRQPKSLPLIKPQDILLSLRLPLESPTRFRVPTARDSSFSLPSSKSLSSSTKPSQSIIKPSRRPRRQPSRIIDFRSSFGGEPSRTRGFPTLELPRIGIPSITSDLTDPFEPTKGILRRSDEAKRKKKKLPKLPRRKTPIAPSFTAIIAELKGGLPEIQTLGGRDIGILPTQIRRLPGKRSKPKKRKSRRNSFLTEL